MVYTDWQEAKLRFRFISTYNLRVSLFYKGLFHVQSIKNIIKTSEFLFYLHPCCSLKQETSTDKYSQPGTFNFNTFNSNSNVQTLPERQVDN
ncbi:hypothetical protein OUZ56_009792 [Daphnia magna]|uniref:Uncharacterized protein n=1 Tax=Daphnia magna TaxID=35525 RepID=A0ABR0AH55_9CRUS|nr:hypothetical protein OUZ56_009792 [Daphnia magna]